MGRPLGVYDNGDEYDDPSLNKCPDCGCLFESLNCPLCGKPCPEDMRAGNRKPPKRKKVKVSSSRVSFVEWYYSWWFIVIMLFAFPIVGLILLATSPYQKKWKIIFAILAIVYMFASYFGLGARLWSVIRGDYSSPVDTRMSESEYKSSCEGIDVGELYRSSAACKGRFVCLSLSVVSRQNDISSSSKYSSYYVCQGYSEGTAFTFLVRDCQGREGMNFVPHDTILIFGECGGNTTIVTESYEELSLPCINMAYADIIYD